MKKSYTAYLGVQKKYGEFAPNIMLASFVVWIVVFACLLFPLFGFGLSFFFSCFLCVGFKKIVMESLKGGKPKIENVFDYYKQCISAFCLQACSLVLIAIWSTAFVIPGVIMGLNYTFAPFLFADNPKWGAIKCLEKSKELTLGLRGELFILYLLQVLFLVLCAMFFCCLMIILNFMVQIPLWLHILIPLASTLFVYFVVIYPYFQMFVANLYLSLFSVQKTKKTSTYAKSIEKVVD